MSTYEYIVQMREKHMRGNKGDLESGEISPPKIEPIKVLAHYFIFSSINLFFVSISVSGLCLARLLSGQAYIRHAYIQKSRLALNQACVGQDLRWTMVM